MSASTTRAVFAAPGLAPASLLDLDTQLRTYQTLVSGCIEIIEVGQFAFVFDEEGKIKGKPVNEQATSFLYDLDHQWIGRDVLVGPVVILGSGSPEFTDVPAEALAWFGLSQGVNDWETLGECEIVPYAGEWWADSDDDADHFEVYRRNSDGLAEYLASFQNRPDARKYIEQRR